MADKFWDKEQQKKRKQVVKNIKKSKMKKKGRNEQERGKQ